MHGNACVMLLGLVFAMGVANFAMHRAVLNSGHPLLAQAPWLFTLLGGRLSLLLEFVMLLGAMLMVAGGADGWLWFYAGYSAVNAGSVWLILSGRI